MAAVIFNGTDVKALKNNLKFKSDVRIMTGDTDDPTSVAKSAPIGSIYIRSGTNDVYIKNDSGSSTNWNKLADTSDPMNPYTVLTVTGTTSAAANTTYLADTTSAGFTITLPTHSLNRFVTIIDKAGTFRTNNLTVARNGGTGNINGAASSFTMDSDRMSLTFLSDGTNWFLA